MHTGIKASFVDTQELSYMDNLYCERRLVNYEYIKW